MTYVQLLIMLGSQLVLFSTVKHMNKRKKIRAVSVLKGLLVLGMLCVLLAIFLELKR